MCLKNESFLARCLTSSLAGLIRFGLSEQKAFGKVLNKHHVQGVRVSLDDMGSIRAALRCHFNDNIYSVREQAGSRKFPTGLHCPFHLVWLPVVDDSYKPIKDLWILEIHVLSGQRFLENMFFIADLDKESGIKPVTYEYDGQDLKTHTGRDAVVHYLEHSMNTLIREKSHFGETETVKTISQEMDSTLLLLSQNRSLALRQPVSFHPQVEKVLSAVFLPAERNPPPRVLLVSGLLNARPCLQKRHRYSLQPALGVGVGFGHNQQQIWYSVHVGRG